MLVYSNVAPFLNVLNWNWNLLNSGSQIDRFQMLKYQLQFLGIFIFFSNEIKVYMFLKNGGKKRQIEEGKSIKCVSADDRYNGNQPPLHTRATYLTHPGYTQPITQKSVKLMSYDYSKHHYIYLKSGFKRNWFFKCLFLLFLISQAIVIETVANQSSRWFQCVWRSHRVSSRDRTPENKKGQIKDERHAQTSWVFILLFGIPCTLRSVSQNFCSSVKYLSRMKTFERPMVAILGGGGWISWRNIHQFSVRNSFHGVSLCTMAKYTHSHTHTHSHT